MSGLTRLSIYDNKANRFEEPRMDDRSLLIKSDQLNNSLNGVISAINNISISVSDVSIDNFPTNQVISGNVNVDNFPSISANVNVDNFPPFPTSFNVDNFPAFPTSINVDNFPAFPTSINVEDSNMTSNIIITNNKLDNINSNVLITNSILSNLSFTDNLTIGDNYLNTTDHYSALLYNEIKTDFTDKLINVQANNNYVISPSCLSFMNLMSLENTNPATNEDGFITMKGDNDRNLWVKDRTANTNLTNINSNIVLTNTGLSNIDSELTDIKNALITYDLKQLRSEGRCYTITHSNASASSTFIYINNPPSSGLDYYIYNIMISVRPGASAVGFITFKIAYSNWNFTNATALNIVPLNTNFQPLITNSIAGTGGTVPNTTHYNLFTSVINSNAQSISIDLQEEYIQIAPGTCFWADYGVIGSTAIVDCNIRYFYK